MKFAVWSEQNIIESRVNPALKIIKARFGVFMRSPGHCEWIHAIFEFEDMCGEGAIFTAASGDDAVVSAIFAAVLVAESDEFVFSRFPIDFGLFDFCKLAGATDAVVVKLDGRFDV